MKREVELENPWLNLEASLVHPDDEEALKEYAHKLVGDYEVQRDLLPFPFFGCPNQAEVFILASNPGYVIANRQEQKDSVFREAFRRSLKHCTLHPYLDPRFEETAGYKWWQKRLQDVFQQFEPENHHLVTEKLMCIQMFPYHSKSFRRSIARHLPTQEYTLHLVRNAVREQKEIVVLRAPWRDLLRQMLAPAPLDHFPFITVLNFQGQRTPCLNAREGWMTPAQFERIIGNLKVSLEYQCKD